jgi:hypothetical protein
LALRRAAVVVYEWVSTPLRQPTVNGFARDCGVTGTGAMIRDDAQRIDGTVAVAAGAGSCARASNLLLGGLLLLISP